MLPWIFATVSLAGLSIVVPGLLSDQLALLALFSRMVTTLVVVPICCAVRIAGTMAKDDAPVPCLR